MDRSKYLMRLMVSCPHGKTVDDCPFRAYNNMPLDRLILLHSTMDFEHSTQMIEHHKNCMKIRNNCTKESKFEMEY